MHPAVFTFGQWRDVTVRARRQSGEAAFHEEAESLAALRSGRRGFQGEEIGQ